MALGGKMAISAKQTLDFIGMGGHRQHSLSGKTSQGLVVLSITLGRVVIRRGNRRLPWRSEYERKQGKHGSRDTSM